MDKEIEIHPLENGKDDRGEVFQFSEETFSFLRETQDFHIVTMVPESIRGNHYHMGRKEWVVVLYSDAWIFAWSDREGSEVETKKIEGKGAVWLEIEEGISHAFKNTGKIALTILSFSDKKYHPSDTFRKVLL